MFRIQWFFYNYFSLLQLLWSPNGEENVSLREFTKANICPLLPQLSALDNHFPSPDKVPSDKECQNHDNNNEEIDVTDDSMGMAENPKNQSINVDEIQNHIDRIEVNQAIERLLSESDTSECEDNDQIIQLHPELIRKSEAYPDIQELFNTNLEKIVIFERIPLGNKTNTSYAVVNPNVENFATGKPFSNPPDDKGAKSKPNSNVFVYERLQDGTLVKRAQISYDVKKKKFTIGKGGPEFSEDTSNFVVIKSAASHHIANKSFMRKVTYFLEVPAGYEGLKDVVFIDYKGTDTDKGSSKVPHKSSKKNTHPYFKHPKEALKQLQDAIKANPKARPKDLLRATKNTQQPLNGIRGSRTVYNFLQRMDGSKPKAANAADQVVAIIQELRDQPKDKRFVQEIFLNVETGLPSFITYYDWQIDLFMSRCQDLGPDSTVFMVDKTYNVANCYVTQTCFVSKDVKRTKNGERVIIPGPTYFHYDSSRKTYSKFYGHLKEVLYEKSAKRGKPMDPVMLIGSDQEKAIRQAAKWAFPQSRFFYCTRHIKENMVKKDLAGVSPKEKAKIVNQVFGDNGWGPNGLTSATSKPHFNKMKDKIDQSKFPPGRFDALCDKLLSNVENRLKSKNNVEPNWTSNGVESENGLLKFTTGWSIQKLPQLVDYLRSIADDSREEIMQGFAGCGNVMVEGNIGRLCKRDMTVWSGYTESEQFEVFQKFTKGVKPVPDQVTSADGSYTVKYPGKVKKKPHQYESVKKHRTVSSPKPKQGLKRTRKSVNSDDEPFPDSVDLFKDAMKDLGVKVIAKRKKQKR